MTLTAYQTAVTSLVRDRDAVISDTEHDAAIADAVALYSAAQPRTVVVDVPGADAARVDLPQGFTDDSQLLAIEYPIGVIPTQEIPLAEVSIYRSPTERQMALPLPVASNDSVRVSYTAAHVLDATQDTIPARHAHAVQCLAAAMLCGQLASYYAGDSEPTIGADTVNHQSKADLWRRRAKDLAATYDDVVGAAGPARSQGASATKQLHNPNALGRPNLFHPTRRWPVH